MVVTIRRIVLDSNKPSFSAEGVSRKRSEEIKTESGVTMHRITKKSLIHEWVEFETVEEAIEFKLKYL